jgi:polyisoprenoid-binding protein YceI
VKIDPSSIDTNNRELEEKLRGEKFFNTAKFPVIRFDSVQLIYAGYNTLEVLGDLEWMGMTKPLNLSVIVNSIGVHPYTGKKTIGVTARATLKRSDFGISEYIPSVGDKVDIVIDAEFYKDEKPGDKKR